MLCLSCPKIGLQWSIDVCRFRVVNSAKVLTTFSPFYWGTEHRAWMVFVTNIGSQAVRCQRILPAVATGCAWWTQGEYMVDTWWNTMKPYTNGGFHKLEYPQSSSIFMGFSLTKTINQAIWGTPMTSWNPPNPYELWGRILQLASKCATDCTTTCNWSGGTCGDGGALKKFVGPGIQHGIQHWISRLIKHPIVGGLEVNQVDQSCTNKVVFSRVSSWDLWIIAFQPRYFPGGGPWALMGLVLLHKITQSGS